MTVANANGMTTIQVTYINALAPFKDIDLVEQLGQVNEARRTLAKREKVIRGELEARIRARSEGRMWPSKGHVIAEPGGTFFGALIRTSSQWRLDGDSIKTEMLKLFTGLKVCILPACDVSGQAEAAKLADARISPSVATDQRFLPVTASTQ